MSASSLNNRYNGHVEREDFFSLVRHYENNFIRECALKGEAASRIGEDGHPSNEVIRFKSIPSLGFSLDSIRLKEADSSSMSQYEYLVSFIGLLGASGVLPQHYIKLALERIKHGDFALSDFIGIFEHRLISLYYKSLGKYKLPVQYENSEGKETDHFSLSLKSFASCYGDNPVQIFYSGHYAKSNRPLSNLELMIAELVQARVTTRSMVGCWLPIMLRDRCQIGRQGKNHQLGAGVILGKRYWDIQSKIIIGIHDIDMPTFLTLQTGEPLYQRLASAVNAYVPPHISVCFEFHVRCKRGEVNPLGKGLQLNNNAWLMSKSKDVLISKRLLSRK